MTDRIIDIADEPASLSVHLGRLVIRRRGPPRTYPLFEGGSDGTDDTDFEPTVTLPLTDLAVLVVSNPQVHYTHAVVAGIASAGGAMIACNEKHLPVGMLLPLEGHFTQSERFAKQAQASAPTCKQIWKQIVKAKVRAQGRLLVELHGDDAGLIVLAKRVTSGDTSNIEAQASRKYWLALFKDPAFRRDRDEPDQNRILNYGYAVLRAIVARAVCAAGLHPSLGVHHHNRYDAYCLADDLMEPFRPIVDRAVVKWLETHEPDAPLDREGKAALLESLTRRFDLGGEKRTLFDIVTRAASSLADVLAGERKSLVLPEI